MIMQPTNELRLYGNVLQQKWTNVFNTSTREKYYEEWRDVPVVEVKVKPKIEAEKWYMEGKWLLFYKEEGSNGLKKCYGFHKDGEWINDERDLEGMAEASHEYVKERLIEEAKKRGYYDVSKTFIPVNSIGKVRHNPSDIESAYTFWEENNHFRMPCIGVSDHIFSGSSTIFKDGIWAEILPPEKKYPMSVDEIEGRVYWMTHDGEINEETDKKDCPRRIRNTSTPERLKALLALSQLVELRDKWNEVDGFVADYNNENQRKFCIGISNKIEKPNLFSTYKVMHFGSEETRDKFLSQFRSLIETAKEFL